jgi:hypothetical protein
MAKTYSAPGRADSDVLTLHVDIVQLKKGSARLLGLVPFAAPL